MSSPETSSRRVAFLLFLLVFLTTGYFHQGGGDNENSRIAQVRMIAEEGQLEIDRWAHRSADVVTIGGHVYPNKAPGLTFLGVPAWVVSHAVARVAASEPKQQDHLASYFVHMLTVGVASASLTVLLFLVLLRWDFSLFHAALGAAAISLGTILLPFSTLYFSHIPAAALLFACYFFVQGHRGGWWTVLAGALGGFSVATEYPAAIGAVLIGFSLLPDWRRCLLLGIGGIVGVLPLLFYNGAAFGTPFYVAYAAYAQSADSAFAQHGMGFLGVKLLDWRTLFEVTFGAQRGLFRFNPWLILAPIGLLIAWDIAKERRPVILCFVIGVAYILFNASYGDSIVFWGGGTSFGPRHLIPGLPFLGLATCWVLRRLPSYVVTLPLIVLSTMICLMGTAIEPRLPYDYQFPITEFLWRAYLRGDFAQGWNGIFHSDLVTADSTAWNLGKLLQLPGPLQLVPLGVFWALVGTGLFFACRVSLVRVERLVGGVGLLALFVFFATPLFTSFANPEWREQGGLVARVFAGNPFANTLVLTGTAQPPSHEGFDNRILFPSGYPAMVEGNFAVEWRGTLWVEEDGFYTFATDSDDGSAIYLNGVCLVDNWLVQAPHRKVEAVTLSRGPHDLTIRYFNEGPGGMLVAHWAKAGRHLRPIGPRDLRAGPAWIYQK